MSKSPGERTSTHKLAERLREELRDYALVAGYLWVCFSALLFYKSAILREAGLSVLPFGTAAVKALILGKFALLGRAAGLDSRSGARTVLQLILRKSVWFVALLVALTVLEELVVGRIHGHSFAETLAEHGAHVLLEIAANSLVLLLVVGAFIAVLEISRGLGPGVMSRTLRSPPGETDA